MTLILILIKFEKMIANPFLTNKFIFMKRTMVAYTKNILERVSFDPSLFCKELQKALKILLPYEIEQLIDWLFNYTNEKPELRKCMITLNK